MSDPKDQLQDLAFENVKLKEENARLFKRVKSLEDSNASWWNIRFLIGKKIGEVFLGWRLTGSIKRLLKEIKDKNVQNETIGDVLTHVLWRFTRVGLIAVLLAIIPSGILVIQVLLMRNQNRLLSIQNERIEQQNHLIEAQRRSSYVFLMGNIMDGINRELQDKSNKKRIISPELQGEVISLSHSLTPYRFMLDGKLTNESLSPERGMLLVFLLESNLDQSNLNDILERGNFESSYFTKLELKADSINELDLSYSNINLLTISGSFIDGLFCNSCSFKEIEIIENSDCLNIFLDAYNSPDSSVNSVYVSNSKLLNFNISAPKISKLLFTNSDLDVTTINSNEIFGILFNGGASRETVINCSMIENLFYKNTRSDYTIINIPESSNPLYHLSDTLGDSKYFNFGGRGYGDPPIITNAILTNLTVGNSFLVNWIVNMHIKEFNSTNSSVLNWYRKNSLVEKKYVSYKVDSVKTLGTSLVNLDLVSIANNIVKRIEYKDKEFVILSDTTLKSYDTYIDSLKYWYEYYHFNE